MQKSLLPLGITSSTQRHQQRITHLKCRGQCGILVTLKPGHNLHKAIKHTLQCCSTAGKNTLWISTWSNLSGAASRVTVKEGPQHKSVAQQVPLLATAVGVNTVAVSKCQTCSGLPHHTPHPCWQSAAEQRDKLQHVSSQALGWQLTFNSILACHAWCPVSTQ